MNSPNKSLEVIRSSPIEMTAQGIIIALYTQALKGYNQQ